MAAAVELRLGFKHGDDLRVVWTREQHVEARRGSAKPMEAVVRRCASSAESYGQPVTRGLRRAADKLGARVPGDRTTCNRY